MARKPAPEHDPVTLEPLEAEPLSGLELFEDETAGDLTWWFYRMAEAGQAENERHGYCWKHFGTVDPETVQAELGGGVYRVLGKRDGQLVKKLRIRIAGAPRVYAGAAPASPGGAPVADPVAARLDRLEGLIEKLAERPATSDLDRLVPLVQLVAGARPDPSSMIGPMLSMFERGASLANAHDGADIAGIIRESVQGLATLVVRPAASSPAAPAAARARDSMDDLLIVLERAMASGRTAGDAADAAESIVSEHEIAQLRAVPDATVITAIRPRLAHLAPADRERFETFVTAFLAELRKPPAREGGGEQ